MAKAAMRTNRGTRPPTCKDATSTQSAWLLGAKATTRNKRATASSGCPVAPIIAALSRRPSTLSGFCARNCCVVVSRVSRRTCEQLVTVEEPVAVQLKARPFGACPVRATRLTST